MSPDRSELLARISAFDIDGGEVALPFAARLAREQGWSRTHADRVVAEYKRYVFLAATTGFTVCPSEDVDAAWHLHLTYTKSYWKRFCGEVLNRPLHHEPTKGGTQEADKHLKMYADTLAAYREAFGYEPPSDIWPTSAERFGDDLKHRVVNTAKNWVIPKSPIKRVAALAGAFTLVAVAAPGCNGGLNPFELKNNDFLITLVLALIGAVCVGRVIRSLMRAPNSRSDDDTIHLNWEQTAYMAGGAGRLTTATIARLFARDLVKVGSDGKTLVPVGMGTDDLSAVERAVLRALPVTNDAAALKPMQEVVEAAFAKQAERLEAGGITLPTTQKFGIVCASLVPLALVVFGLALPRLLMGVEAKKPVQYLQIISVVGLLFGLILTVAGSLRLSNRGLGLLARQSERHAALKNGTQWTDNTDAGMAVAIFGTMVLAGSAMAPLQTWYPRQTSESSGGCGSGCGASGDGGGGCGGGGCGGGGD